MRRALILLFLLCFAGVGDSLRAQESRPPVEVRALGTWQGRSLREASGLAVSRRHPGILWVHNDSGDGPHVYAVDTTGALASRVRGRRGAGRGLGGHRARPCPANLWVDRACLYLADTGDNDQRDERGS